MVALIILSLLGILELCLIITALTISAPYLILAMIALPFICWHSLLFIESIQRKMLFKQVKEQWFPKGKYVIFFYSSSKKWEGYFKEQLIPKIQDKSVIWNWSTRHKDGWRSDLIEAKILSLYCPRRYFCPLAVVFLPNGKVEVFDFYTPYIKMLKSGKTDYSKLEKSFLDCVDLL